MDKVSSVISLLRINQWIKNLFIFLPFFFGMKLMNMDFLIKNLFAFVSFSLTASAVYVFNDMLDVKSDRLHPDKKRRPLASGKIDKMEAVTIILILLTLSFSVLWLTLNRTLVWMLIGGYLFQNILYSIKLKHIAILDVTLIASGFLIRIMVGGVVTNTVLSHWIILITFLLALFLALAKRRDDVLIFIRTGDKMRKNIDGYNLDFLNASMSIMSAVVIVAYIMYSTSSDTVANIGPNLYFTSFFVIIGIMRYLQITFINEKSGSPTNIVLSDIFLQFIILGWLSVFVILIYINPTL